MLTVVVVVVTGRVDIEVEVGNDELIYDKILDSQASVTSKNPYMCKVFLGQLIRTLFRSSDFHS